MDLLLAASVVQGISPFLKLNEKLVHSEQTFFSNILPGILTQSLDTQDIHSSIEWKSDCDSPFIVFVWISVHYNHACEDAS